MVYIIITSGKWRSSRQVNSSTTATRSTALALRNSIIMRSTNNDTKQRLTNNSFLKDPELTIFDPKLYVYVVLLLGFDFLNNSCTFL